MPFSPGLTRLCTRQRLGTPCSASRRQPQMARENGRPGWAVAGRGRESPWAPRAPRGLLMLPLARPRRRLAGRASPRRGSVCPTLLCALLGVNFRAAGRSRGGRRAQGSCAPGCRGAASVRASPLCDVSPGTMSSSGSCSWSHTAASDSGAGGRPSALVRGRPVRLLTPLARLAPSRGPQGPRPAPGVLSCPGLLPRALGAGRRPHSRLRGIFFGEPRI